MIKQGRRKQSAGGQAQLDVGGEAGKKKKKKKSRARSARQILDL